MGLPGLYETILETSGPELCQALKACPSRLDECSDDRHMQCMQPKSWVGVEVEIGASCCYKKHASH